MKSIFLFLLMANPFISGKGVKVIIAEVSASIQMPSLDWVMISHQKVNNESVYHFTRKGFAGTKGQNIVGDMKVIVEFAGVYPDAVTYANHKQEELKWTDVHRYKMEDGVISIPNAIVVQGVYKDAAGTDHTTYVCYLVENGRGAQVVLDVETDGFMSLNPEFLSVLRSIKMLA